MTTVSSQITKSLSSVQNELFRKTFSGRNVVVTGGASFIGSNLVDSLLDFGAIVRVVDDLSSGKMEYIPIARGATFQNVDLRERKAAYDSLNGADFVFHLAAIHGGRGFIETYKKDMLANFAIDNNVFAAATELGVESIVHASSACAYPIDLQESEMYRNLLTEEQASMDNSSSCFADGVYGWTKLMGEYQLENSVLGTKTKGRSARIFTAYGDRENESHAAIALIAKALLKAEPYPIWGSGEQTRNFTYVADTITGLLFLASDQRAVQFDVFNIGTSDHVKVIDFVSEIFEAIGWKPSEIKRELDKPVGVASRASDNLKIQQVFGWSPTVSISDGIKKTVDWYVNSGLLPVTLIDLEERLMAR